MTGWHQADLVSCFKGSIPSLKKLVDFPSQPRLLIGPDSDGLEDSCIVNAFGDVCSD